MIQVTLRWDDGRTLYRVEDKEVPKEQLEAALRSYVRKDNRTTLLLDADPDVPHGDTVYVEDKARGGGWTMCCCWRRRRRNRHLSRPLPITDQSPAQRRKKWLLPARSRERRVWANPSLASGLVKTYRFLAFTSSSSTTGTRTSGVLDTGRRSITSSRATGTLTFRLTTDSRSTSRLA